MSRNRSSRPRRPRPRIGDDAISELKGGAEYDYVVVGSGAGGGPLAANLAQAGQKVLLLEAGGDDEPHTYRVPAFHGLATEDPALRWDFFVRHYADDAQQQLDSKFTRDRDGVLYPRSGTLGGCTAHNAMITMYPHNSDWDEIARSTGDRSWSSQNMRRYFERLERCAYVRPPRLPAAVLGLLTRLVPGAARFLGNPGRHGFRGWLGTSLPDPRLVIKDVQLLRVILAAAKATLEGFIRRPLTVLEGFGTYLDPNDWRAQNHGQQGLWLVPTATSRGRRNGTRERIRAVQSEHPQNLSVKTGALVSRVLFDDTNAAIGVEYLEGRHLYRADPAADGQPAESEPKQVRVRREVILSAGAFNTPQILKLSGIGPAAELARFGIPVRVDLPGVGENLQDRYEVGVVSEMATDFSLLKECGFAPPGPGQKADPCFTQWLSGTGPYATNGVVLGIIRKSRQELPDPDLFIFGLPGFFQGYYPKYSEELERQRNVFTWAILKAHTRNTAGYVRLRSADPRDVPDINFKYFAEGNDSDGADIECVLEGVQFVREMMARVGDLVKGELVPGEQARTDEELRQFIRNQAWGHHASCTCKMGPASDPMAVVDSKFRVHGTTNLRVVDASVFPRIPGFFIVTPIYMISEKASDDILSQEAQPARGIQQLVSRAASLLRRPRSPKGRQHDGNGDAGRRALD